VTADAAEKVRSGVEQVLTDLAGNRAEADRQQATTTAYRLQVRIDRLIAGAGSSAAAQRMCKRLKAITESVTDLEKQLPELPQVRLERLAILDTEVGTIEAALTRPRG
jgi:hypothetical protein